MPDHIEISHKDHDAIGVVPADSLEFWLSHGWEEANPQRVTEPAQPNPTKKK